MAVHGDGLDYLDRAGTILEHLAHGGHRAAVRRRFPRIRLKCLDGEDPVGNLPQARDPAPAGDGFRRKHPLAHSRVAVSLRTGLRDLPRADPTRAHTLDVGDATGPGPVPDRVCHP